MILIDTSAWIEFFRGTGSPTCREVRRLLDGNAAVTEPIVMEVLAGARDEQHLRDLRGVLGLSQLNPCNSGDYETAAMLYRACRRGGATVRRLIDCLIAAVAIRSGLPVLHNDSDFDILAEYTGLTVHHS